MDYKSKEGVFQIAIAITLTVAVILGAVFIVIGNKEDKKDDIKPNILSSDIVSTDPRESTVNFITYNGTIGDTSTITSETIPVDGFGLNRDRRLEALDIVESSIVPGSPLINGRERQNIFNMTDDDCFPSFFEIRNLKVGEPSKVGKITVYDDSGNVEYDYVDIYVDFDSYKISYIWPLDASGDGSVSKVEGYDTFTDVKVTLVKSGDLWFIYDVEDSENLLNVRFATWSGIAKNNIDVEEEVVERIVPAGVDTSNVVDPNEEVEDSENE